MPLNDFFSDNDLSIHTTAFTVMAPGSVLDLALDITVQNELQLVSIEWSFPANLSIKTNPLDGKLPLDIKPSAGWQGNYELSAQVGQQGFGWIEFVLQYKKPDRDSVIELKGKIWISIFEFEKAPYPEPLADHLRDRLIAVTNAEPRNGHIFLADFALYFSDYLNVGIDPSAVPEIAAQVPFATDGLPVDSEIRGQIRRGGMLFYGIDDLKMFGEEECEQADSHFITESVKDVEDEFS